MADRVLVTGGTGFVGAAAVRAFIEAGYEVSVMARDGSPRWLLAGLPVVFRTADLRRPESLESALSGADLLCHVAADYRLWTRDPHEIFLANVAGTRALMQAALRVGMRRIVHTSSVATLAPRPDGAPADETANIDRKEAIGAYKLSKLMSEKDVLQMVDEQGLPAVVVNPTTPIGAGDIRPTPTGRIILEAARGRMPAYVETGLNFVHVEDVARGIVAAMEHGRIGQRYLLGGDNVTLRGLLEQVSREVARKPPAVQIPIWAAMPIAFAEEAIAHVTGREPFATRDGIRMARHAMYFSSAKAERELGYVHRPFSAGIADAVNWFTRNGYLKDGWSRSLGNRPRPGAAHAKR